MPESLENLSVEEAIRIMRERIGNDGTVALISLFRHAQGEVIGALSARFEHLEARIDRIRAELYTRMEGVHGDLHRRVDGIHADLHSRIDELRSDLDSRVDGIRSDLSSRMDGVHADVNTRLDGLNTRIDSLNARIDSLNARVDTTLRYAITFSLSLLGLVAAVATGILAWRA